MSKTNKMEMRAALMCTIISGAFVVVLCKTWHRVVSKCSEICFHAIHSQCRSIHLVDLSSPLLPRFVHPDLNMLASTSAVFAMNFLWLSSPFFVSDR